VLTQLANALRERSDIDERESFIDACLPRLRAVAMKSGRGVKILTIVDRHGLPLSREPDRRQSLPTATRWTRNSRRTAWETITRNRSTRKLKTQGRRLLRYARRWIVERFFAWL
jgi:hypothetical protein